MLIFTNGNIHTMDAAHPTPHTVIVGDDGRIAAIDGEVPRGAPVIDLGGRTLLPGFNDAHVHIWKLGLLLTVQVDARSNAAPTIPAIVEAFRARAATVPAGTWLTGRGYNEADLPEGRHPTRADLDAAAPDHPIALTRTCGHMIVANSMALRLAGIDRDSGDPPGGFIVHDTDSEPTGLLQETAMGLLTRAIPEPNDAIMRAAITAAHAHQLALGITSATDPLLMPSHLRAYHQLEAAGEIAVRTHGLPIRRPDGGTETLPLPEKYRSDTLRIDGVKFFADGGLSGATAAISGVYKETGTHGVLRFADEELLALMREAHDAGFRIATHAIGDMAIEQVLSCYEALYARDRYGAGGLTRLDPLHGGQRRHRIEHLGLPTAEHLARARALDVIAVPQTVFLPALGMNFHRYLPDDLLPNCYPVRAMLDAGLTVALSSDAPVVQDDNPLLGMKAAIDRKGSDGEPIAADQAITPYEALYAYTMGGAIASGDADNRGSITPGKWADLVILDGDPLAIGADDPSGLLDVRVVQTFVGGGAVYGG